MGSIKNDRQNIINSQHYLKSKILSLLYFYKKILIYSLLLALFYISATGAIWQLKSLSCDEITSQIADPIAVILLTWGFTGGAYLNHRQERYNYSWFRNLHWKISHLLLFSYFLNFIIAVILFFL